MAKPVAIESVLGPAIERYFAFGYRRVSHDLSHVFLPDQAMELHAIGTATYPNDWSIDSQGRPREAHLSSVDAITLAALAFERFADLHARNAAGSYITTVQLRSGPEPWWDLTQVPVSMRFSLLENNHVSLRGEVGNMRVGLTVDQSCTTEFDSSNEATFESVVGGCAYGWLLQTSSSEIALKAFDPERRVLTAEHRVHAAPQDPHPVRGLESAYRPAATAIDYLVAMGQLAQALIYECRGGNRSTVDNLWMRSMTISIDSKPQRVPCSFGSSTELVRDVIQPRINPHTHDVEVRSRTSNGVRATAKLAYHDRRRA